MRNNEDPTQPKINKCVCVCVTQLCLTLCHPMDCSPRLLCPWNSTGKNSGVGCHSLLQGFPDSSVGKESACNAGDPSSIPGSGRSAREGIGYPLQYSWASLVPQLVENLPAMLGIHVSNYKKIKSAGPPNTYITLALNFTWF